MTTTTADLPLLLTEVECRAVRRLSPSFVRIELGSPDLADLGVDGPWWDQRIKLVFPHGGAGAEPPSFDGADESWFTTWIQRPVEERGHMRTYTVREVVGEGAETRVVVDFIVHEGECGPGGTWGATASVGDRLVLMGPRRGVEYGGIEFVPGDAETLLLVGDETAVPAIGAVLAQLDADARGHVFVEVPYAADVLELEHPEGVTVTWLPRDGAPRGEDLHAAVLEHLGAGPRHVEVPEVPDEDVDPDLWETPAYSSSGEDVEAPVRTVDRFAGLYAWIAGESKVVTGLRRAMVRDLGIDRHQVAFMGYWRVGVAMQS
jgi:NADPH-dependent ferric siderophore reductase